MVVILTLPRILRCPRKGNKPLRACSLLISLSLFLVLLEFFLLIGGALPRRFTYFWEDSLDIYRPFDYDESGNPRGYEAERDSLSGTFDTVSGDDFIQVEAELQARVLNPPK